MPVIETKLLARNKTAELHRLLRWIKNSSLKRVNLEIGAVDTACLAQWRNDQFIVAVFVDGAGDKLFCRWWRVQCINQWKLFARSKSSGKSKLEQSTQFLSDFFSQGITALTIALHTYPKPIITWADLMGVRSLRCI